MRITKKRLARDIEIINTLLNRPMETWPYEKNIGNFHLSQAYGGYCLHETVNGGGAVSDTFFCGHIPAKDLHKRMQGMIEGIRLAKESK